ncbi:MAG: isoprenyl transferase [Saprospiraceae bacterium]|nr:isoprenyl transferase [Saprospiraceae bacterium]
MSKLKELIDKERLPRHVAVIMDGNGRWAKKHGRPRVFGHKNGVQSVRETSEAAAEIGIEYLTLYAFSRENWKRPKLEVNALMSLLVDTLRKEINTLNDNNIKLEAIGDIKKLPAKSYTSLMEGIENTKNNSRMTLVLALNYSSRWEITEAARKLSEDVKKGIIDPQNIEEGNIISRLETNRYPDPELLIRTSGELRISNFLLWQIAYSELYFTEKYWPEFNKEEFYKAIIDYQSRERRFGLISEQIKT